MIRVIIIITEIITLISLTVGIITGNHFQTLISLLAFIVSVIVDISTDKDWKCEL